MVTTYDEISVMLADLGPEFDFASVSMFQRFQSWVIELDDETDQAITLDYDEPSGKLYFRCLLSPVAEDRRLSVYDILLQYNFFWTESGGGRMALDGRDGNVVQIYDVPLYQLDYGTLKKALNDFMVTTQLMSITIGETGVGISGDAQLFGQQDVDDLPDGRIKV